MIFSLVLVIFLLFLVVGTLLHKKNKLEERLASKQLDLLIAREEIVHSEWKSLDSDRIPLPEYNTPVLCFIPSWNEYKVCVLKQGNIWFDSEGELGIDNKPNMYQQLLN
jgi:hypothetical protein